MLSMYQVSSEERDLEAGNGESTSTEEDVNLCSAVLIGVSGLDKSSDGEHKMESIDKFSRNGAEELDQLMDKRLTDEESRLQKAFWDKVYAVKKKKNSKKPPLPPKGPSLDAVDKRLIKELVEQANDKRMQKIRVAKEASSRSLCRILTFVIAAFSVGFLVFNYGHYKRSRAFVMFQGSPGPAAAAEQGFMSLQFYNSLSPNAGNGPN